MDAIKTMFVMNICTSGVLERTRSHEIEKSSLIPDYLLLARQSATKQNNRKIAIGNTISVVLGFRYIATKLAHSSYAV